MNRLRVAIVGCGWVAGTQMTVGFAPIADLFSVVACCDSDADRANAFAATHQIPHAASHLSEILAMETVDVVSICTPPSLHYQMVLECLEAGKHVICEKPFASSLAQVDEIIAAERWSKGRVMPIFQYRFGKGIARIQHLIRSGLVGRAYVSSFETSWQRDADYYTVPWRGKYATELGGVLVSQAIHIHDLCTWLMGRAASVTAFKATRVNPIEVEDCAVASLKMADGSLASLTATLGSRHPTTRIRLCFENATIERQCSGAEAPSPGGEPWSVFPLNSTVGAQLEAKMAEAAPGPSSFAGQFALFHEALSSGASFPVTLDDARNSLELITAIYHASETGSAVCLPIEAGHERYGGWAQSART